MKALIALLCFAMFVELDDIRRQLAVSHSVQSVDEPQACFNREGRGGKILGGRHRDKEPDCPGGKCPPGGGGKTPPVGEGAPDFKPNPPGDDVAPPAPPVVGDKPTPPQPDCTAAVEALKTQINIMQSQATTVIGGMSGELDALKKELAETTAKANKPFWISVWDKSGKYTTDPQAVHLGEEIKLKLQPIASGGG